MGFNSLNIQGAMRPAPAPGQGLASVQDMLDGFFSRRQDALKAELQAQLAREQMAQSAENTRLNYDAAQRAQETARQRLAFDAYKQQQDRADELRKNVTTAAASKEVQDALAAGNVDEANARVQPYGTRFEAQAFKGEELPEVADAPEKPLAMRGQEVADTLSAVSSGLIPRMSVPVDEGERAGFEQASAAQRAQQAARDAVESRNRAGAADYEARPRYRLAPVVADGIPGLDIGGEFIGGARRSAANQVLDQRIKALRELPGGDVISKRVEAAFRDSALAPKDLAAAIDKVVADERALAVRAKKGKGGAGAAGSGKAKGPSGLEADKLDTIGARLQADQNEWFKAQKVDDLLAGKSAIDDGLDKIASYRQDGNTIGLRDVLYKTARAITGPGVLTESEFQNTVQNTAGLWATVQSALAKKASGELSDEEVAKLDLFLKKASQAIRVKAAKKVLAYDSEFLDPQKFRNKNFPEFAGDLQSFRQSRLLDTFELSPQDLEAAKARLKKNQAGPAPAKGPLPLDDDDELERIAEGLK